jgi:hypothetical protein
MYLDQKAHRALQDLQVYKALKANQDQLEPMVKTAQLVQQDPLAHKVQQDHKVFKVSQEQMV